MRTRGLQDGTTNPILPSRPPSTTTSRCMTTSFDRIPTTCSRTGRKWTSTWRATSRRSSARSRPRNLTECRLITSTRTWQLKSFRSRQEIFWSWTAGSDLQIYYMMALTRIRWSVHLKVLKSRPHKCWKVELLNPKKAWSWPLFAKSGKQMTSAKAFWATFWGNSGAETSTPCSGTTQSWLSMSLKMAGGIVETRVAGPSKKLRNRSNLWSS